ncbi:MAG: DUF3575 domain-containing protein [Rikenellaceae bacterium]
MKKYLVFLIIIFSLEHIYAFSLVVDFPQGSSSLEESEREKIKEYFKSIDISELTQIQLYSNTSPEGSAMLNDTLSFARAKSVKQFLIQEFSLSDSLFLSYSSRVDWPRFEQLVYLYDVPFKAEVLECIAKRDISLLKNFRGGEIYSYIYKYVYPSLRTCSVDCDFKPKREQVVSLYYFAAEPQQLKPLFAIKTNLLYDLLTLVNIELEVPISQRISLATEFIFPWWSSPSGDFTLQMRAFHFGVNYWLGDRSRREIMQGWNVGFMGGYGLYDFQIFSQKGVQGRFFDLSLTGGYAHAIAKNLRLEYQLALGYLHTKQEKYTDLFAENYGDIKVVSYPWQTSSINWFGVTRARVSLVWMINSARR